MKWDETTDVIKNAPTKKNEEEKVEVYFGIISSSTVRELGCEEQGV